MRLIAVVVGGVDLRRRERFRSFSYDELAGRDKVNLDITWLRDESLEDLDNLPAPEVIAREIVEDLTAALAEFEAVAAALEAAAHGAATDGAVRMAPARRLCTGWTPPAWCGWPSRSRLPAPSCTQWARRACRPSTSPR
jgi:hypothetical protein